MPKPLTIVLDDRSAAFVESMVAQRRYGSPSDVVNYGLRWLEMREEQVDRLRSALIEDERSGAPLSFDTRAFLKARRRSTSQDD